MGDVSHSYRSYIVSLLKTQVTDQNGQRVYPTLAADRVFDSRIVRASEHDRYPFILVLTNEEKLSRKSPGGQGALTYDAEVTVSIIAYVNKTGYDALYAELDTIDQQIRNTVLFNEELISRVEDISEITIGKGPQGGEGGGDSIGVTQMDFKMHYSDVYYPEDVGVPLRQVAVDVDLADPTPTGVHGHDDEVDLQAVWRPEQDD